MQRIYSYLGTKRAFYDFVLMAIMSLALMFGYFSQEAWFSFLPGILEIGAFLSVPVGILTFDRMQRDFVILLVAGIALVALGILFPTWLIIGGAGVALIISAVLNMVANPRKYEVSKIQGKYFALGYLFMVYFNFAIYLFLLTEVYVAAFMPRLFFLPPVIATLLAVVLRKPLLKIPRLILVIVGGGLMVLQAWMLMDAGGSSIWIAGLLDPLWVAAFMVGVLGNGNTAEQAEARAK